ncbi:MAG: hypothetical protein Q3998_03085 [Porphyromonas sp.]|nr:hypothetical protein [Porphyromonas sp.]
MTLYLAGILLISILIIIIAVREIYALREKNLKNGKNKNRLIWSVIKLLIGIAGIISVIIRAI